MLSWIFGDTNNYKKNTPETPETETCPPKKFMAPKKRRGPTKERAPICPKLEAQENSKESPQQCGSGDCPNENVDSSKTENVNNSKAEDVTSTLPCHLESLKRRFQCYLTTYHFLLAASVLLVTGFVVMNSDALFTSLMWLFGLLRYLVPTCWLKSSDQRIHEALAKYAADTIGIADYALESAGGSVLCSSDTYHQKTGLIYSLFGLALWYSSSTPREVILPDVHPGRCWAMDGNHGYVSVQLRTPVMVSGVSLEHIPKELMPFEEDRTSVPREFAIIGKAKDMSSPDVVLGKFTYHNGSDSEAIQQFSIKDPGCSMAAWPFCGTNTQPFRIITLKVLSNHGNADYTCVYRLRVHGKPVLRPAGVPV